VLLDGPVGDHMRFAAKEGARERALTSVSGH
jgi:hypothetical protein